MNVFGKVKHPSEEKETCAGPPSMKTFTLILPLEATTDINPSDSSEVAAEVTTGMIAVVKSGALID